MGKQEDMRAPPQKKSSIHFSDPNYNYSYKIENILSITG